MNDDESVVDASLKPVLNTIFYLGSLQFIDKHLVFFYQGGYFTKQQQQDSSSQLNSSEPSVLIREAILELCAALKDDSIALVDATAPPDYVLNSPLGDSRGDVYNRLYSMMTQTPNALERIGNLDNNNNKNNNEKVKARL